MRKFLLNLLFVALTVPWVTQVNAQCDNNAPMCNISIEMFDRYDDGWNGGTLSIYQGTVLRGAVEMDWDYTVQTVSIPVCPDSIRLVWTPGDYDEECSFNIYDAGGTLLLSMAEGSLEVASGDLITIYATCPSCLRPASFTTTGNTPTSIDLEWIDSVATTWQMVYGPVGINPDSVLAQIQEGEVLDNLTTNTLTISDLEAGVPMDCYLRADCGAGDYSAWKPLLGIAAGTYNMAATGIDTVTTCGMVIYDDGGMNGNYAASANSTLIIYPTEGNVISMYGSINSENNYDYLKIYDGAGTSGPLLGEYAGDVTIDPFISDLGPITLVFTSDASMQYNGFELFVSCVEAPACARPYSPSIVSIGNNDVTIAWLDSTATYNYEIEYDTIGFEVGTGTVIPTTDTVYQLTELLSNTQYEAHIRIVCQNGGYSTDRIIRFRTACDPYPADSLPFVENFDDWNVINPCWKAINSGTAAYPELSSSQSVTAGNKSMRMYNSASGSWNMLVLPLFETPANELQIEFWLKKTNTSYPHQLQVGVISNPADVSTFVPFTQVSPSAANQWERFNVYLNQYQSVNEDGEEVEDIRYIAFRTPATSGYAQLYIDSITVSELPSCTAPENIRIAAVGPFSAMAIWQPNVVGEMQSYTLEVSEAGQDSWTSYTTTDTYMAITDLTLGTAYDVRVRTECADGSSLYSDIINFTTMSCTGAGVIDTTVAADSIYVGDTVAGNSQYLPTYSFYKYSYTQQLFRVDELEGVGTITGIDLTSEGTAVQRNLQIYMTTVQDTVLTAFVSDADFTLVWEGSYAATPGVNHFEFSTPFSYGQSGNLLLVVRDNTGSYVSGIKHATHTTTGRTMARYIYNDNAPYNTVPTGGTSSTSRNDIVFYSYPCDSSINACVAPVLAVANVNPTAADIVWTAGNGETSWDVEYQVQGDTVWTSFEIATTETAITIDQLVPATYYRIRVTNDCGASSIKNIYTECGKLDAYPWYEDFNSATTPAPSCWTGLSTYSSSYPSVNSSYSVDNGKSMYMYHYGSATSVTYTMLATPQVDTTIFPIDTLQVSFAMYNTSTSSLPGAIVGVMTDPQDIATFTPVDTVFCASRNMWEYVEVLLSNYNGGGQYIAVVLKNLGNGVTTNNFYLDDFQVNVMPSCPRPSDVAADTASISITSATITWNSTGAAMYEVQYGAHGFQLGTGMVETSVTNSINLSGLTPSQLYDVYVRGLCEGNDTSEYSFVYSFFTDCAEIDNLPYTENFNGWTGTDLKVPYCWYGNSTYSSSYPSMSTSYDYTGVTGGRSLYLYNSYSATSSYVTKASLPQLAASIPASTTQLVFQLRTGTSTSNYEIGVVVGVSTDPADATTFTPVDTVLATYGEWTTCEVPLDTYTGTGRYITVRDYANILSGTSAYPSIYIDDVRLEAIPTCRRPIELTAGNATTTTVDLSWTDLSNPTSWVVEYGPIGFELGTGTKVAANSNPFTLTGLSTSTFYEYYVRGVCAGTDSSDYSRVGYRFATLQVPAAVPYSYDFESATEWANWQVNCNDTIVNWYRGNAVANGGTQSMYISADTAATNSTLFRRINATAYRDIDFGTIDSSFVLTFDARAGGSTAGVYDGLVVLLADPNDYVEADNNNSFGTPWGSLNDLPIYDIYRLTNDQWQTFEVPFDTISGVHRVAFFWFNQSSQTSWQGEPAAVDNIAINYSTCPRPLNLSAVPGTTTAALSWQGTASGYVVYYRAVDSTNLHSLYTTSNTCTISGLISSGVEYVWAVRAICGNDTSMYSDSDVFKTTCFDGAVTEFPYIEDFEIGLDCWTQEYVSSTEDWYANNGSYYSTDNAYSGSQNALFNYSGHGPTTILVSPVMNLNSISNPYLMFAHMQRNWGTTDQDTLGVYYRLHEDSAWVYLVSYNTHMPDWQLDSIGLPESSSTFQIGFLAHAEYGYGVAIDSVVVNGEGPLCAQPNLTVSILNNTAEITWPEAGNYELQYREATATTFGDVITITNASNYQLTDLLPLTEYVCQVRRNCGEEDGYSIWSEITFTTEDLPCIAPTDFTATNITYTSATVSWTDPSGNQTAWFVEYGYGANFNTITVTSPTVNLSNLYDGTTYSVKVQGQCSATIYSDWSEVFTFSTATCTGVSNVTTGAVTTNSAVINWTAGANQTKWEIAYGMEGFTEGNEISSEIVEGTPSFTITGLESDMKYDVYVRNICQEGVTSAWSNKIQFRTTVGINTALADNVRVQIYPNPANSEATVSVDGINGKVEFVVADMNGRMIVTETINCEGSLVKTIDVSNLAKGAYFVHIYNDDFNTTRKLIVK